MCGKGEEKELTHSLPIDFDTCLTSPFDGIVVQLVDEIIGRTGKKARPSDLDINGRAVSCILANLLRVRLKHRECFLAIPLDKASFARSRYSDKGFGILPFSAAIRHLEENGLIELHKGFKDRVTGVGYRTRVAATDALIERLTNHQSIDQPIQGTLRNLPKGSPFITRKTPLSWTDIVQSPSFEAVRLKDENKNLVDYEDTETTKGMRENLRVWNGFAHAHWADLYLTDDEASRPLVQEEDEDDEFGDENGEEKDDYRYAGVDFSRTSLYRVFNRNSFELGGRFYGGWWQSIPSRFRNRVTIDWHPTRELDYANMLPAMLYAAEGLQLDGDAYSVEGVDPTYRPLIKKTFLQLINAREGQRTREPSPERLPPETSWEAFQTLVRGRHKPIEKHFRTGVGLSLQRKDSDIAEAVMLEMMQRRILVLPIHDSFLVREGHYLALRDTMLAVYEKTMGQRISTTLDGSFKDEGSAPKADTPAISFGIKEALRHAEEEKRFEEKHYSAYLKRKQAILRTWDKDRIADINPKLP